MPHNKEQKFSLLPNIEDFCGPVTKKRLLRLLGFYISFLVLGSALVFLTESHFLQTLGLGLMLPGGGFLADKSIIFALLSGVAFFAALVIWFGTGNVLAPPFLWLLTALLAASTRGESASPLSGDICESVPVIKSRQFPVADYLGGPSLEHQAALLVYEIIGGACFFMICLMALRRLLAIRQRNIDNEYLASQQDKLNEIFSGPSSAEASEMSRQDLQRLRFVLDRALQPVERFDGFEWLDQFQTAAVRYQLNFLAYGLAMTQARFTPAFAGYMHQAQINLLDKQANHRIWSYWKLENIWGNLNSDPDPLGRENIMYTGFVALQMALFESSSGRADFSRQERFNLRHPAGKSYACEDERLIERLEMEYQRSDFFLIACEPNWIYPLCNTIGACAIFGYDSLRQQNKWQKHEKEFRHALDAEFMDSFGRYVPCRSEYTGLAIPTFGGVMPLALPCFFLNAVAPDLAVRQWLLLRRKLFDRQSHFQSKEFWPIDTGNYGFSRASAYTATALAAAELGDDAVYRHCMDALEKECPGVLKDGVIHRQRASVWAHGVEIMARAVNKNGFRNLLLKPKKNAGFYLENLKYPDVLVSSAHFEEERLVAVLYPGVTDGVYDISVGGLQPSKCYHVKGALLNTVIAGHDGKAVFKIMLQGRTCLSFY